MHTIISISYLLCVDPPMFTSEKVQREELNHIRKYIYLIIYLGYLLLASALHLQCFFLKLVSNHVSLQSPQAICTHVTLHFSSSMYITATQVHSSRLSRVWQSVH